MSFQYTFLPADINLPAEARSASKAGGLSDDALLQAAKTYFWEQSGGHDKAKAMSERLAQASPEEKSALVAKFRQQQQQQQHQSSSLVQQLSEEQILGLIQSQYQVDTAQSCDIIALTVPSSLNHFQAVSMYVAQNSTNNTGTTPILNERASALVQNCGHQLPEHKDTGLAPGIYGDVFVGRAYDDEQGGKEWTRLDFLPQDLEEGAQWMETARSPGGGGGTGSSSASSLSNSVQRTFQQQQEHEQKQQEELGFTWDQTEDEVELKFPMEQSSRGKDVQVKFSREHLKVSVLGNVLVDAPTGGKVRVDESTYTIQDNDKGGRELCVILGKLEEGKRWFHAVKKS